MGRRRRPQSPEEEGEHFLRDLSPRLANRVQLSSDGHRGYCTSEFKRGPGGRVITKLFRESPGDVLNVYGFRAEESPARKAKAVFAPNGRFSTRTRAVWDWLPLHDWSERAVWDDIRASGVPHHHAYDLGMPRLSCCFCVFAPRAALLVAGRANRALLDEYVEVERATGHTFQNGRSIESIRDAIVAGEVPQGLHGNWNM